jgi:glucokinase
MILAGDIGGTNTRIALVETTSLGAAVTVREDFASDGDLDLADIVRGFLSAHGADVAAAGMAVAGPVTGGRGRITNLDREIDAAQLAARTGLPRVTLLNDLEAVAFGIPFLQPDDLIMLAPGRPQAAGNLAIIAPGTGLGEAGCYWDGHRHHPFATEGGHADFAPRDALERELLDALHTRFGRVSYERILSGPGIVEIYRFLHDSGRGSEPDSLSRTLRDSATPEPIVAAALERRSERCSLVLEIFISLLGAEAGNLALKVLARGGVYLAGGIAPRIIDLLRGAAFHEAFLAKGRMRPLLEAMPVQVIVNDNAALLGAAVRAAA